MSSEFVVRKMTIEDATIVAEIELECFSLPWSKEALEESLGQDYSYFVVIENCNDIIAYGSVYVLGDEAEIINVAVREAYRKQGCGKMVVEELIRYSESLNVERTILEVRESNLNAIALYEKCGFERIGTRKNFYEKPQENAVIMWKQKH